MKEEIKLFFRQLFCHHDTKLVQTETRAFGYIWVTRRDVCKICNKTVSNYPKVKMTSEEYHTNAMSRALWEELNER